jgi:hypothetical protein
MNKQLIMGTQLLELKNISDVNLLSLNSNEAYLCIDKFGTPAFITGESLKVVKHPEVQNIVMPIKQTESGKSVFGLAEQLVDESYRSGTRGGRVSKFNDILLDYVLNMFK